LAHYSVVMVIGYSVVSFYYLTAFNSAILLGFFLNASYASVH